MVRGEEEGSRQHHLIVEYDRWSSPALSAVLQNNYQQMVGKNQCLGRIFPNVPKELLCRAKLTPVRSIATRAAGQEARSGLTRCKKGLMKCSTGDFGYLKK